MRQSLSCGAIPRCSMSAWPPVAIRRCPPARRDSGCGVGRGFQPRRRGPERAALHPPRARPRVAARPRTYRTPGRRARDLRDDERTAPGVCGRRRRGGRCPRAAEPRPRPTCARRGCRGRAIAGSGRTREPLLECHRRVEILAINAPSRSPRTASMSSRALSTTPSVSSSRRHPARRGRARPAPRPSRASRTRRALCRAPRRSS